MTFMSLNYSSLFLICQFSSLAYMKYVGNDVVILSKQLYTFEKQ